MLGESREFHPSRERNVNHFSDSFDFIVDNFENAFLIRLILTTKRRVRSDDNRVILRNIGNESKNRILLFLSCNHSHLH